MKQFKILFLLLALGIPFFSCGDFDDINTNPDSATSVTSSILATGAIMDLMGSYVWRTGISFAGPFVLCKYLGWGENMDGNQYNLFGGVSFDGYVNLKNYALMGKVANPQDKNAYEGLGLFLKAYKLYNYTIDVGDIPYKDILKGQEGILTPSYDSQKDVFKFLLDDLDNAYELFMQAKNFDGDPIFKGNVTKWAKIVNALELRILINLSKKENDPDLNIKTKFNEVYNRNLLMDSNDDNLQIKFSSKAGQYYPYHNSVNKHYAYAMISKTLIDLLNKNEDYRLFYYAAPSKARLNAGMKEDDKEAYPGIDVSAPIDEIKLKFTTDEYCRLNDRYINYINGEPFAYFSYAEQNFILAEAALRGWIVADPSIFYKKGIEASMRFIVDNTPDDNAYHHGRKIDEEVIANMLNSSTIQLTGSFEEKLEKIIEQKYIAGFMQLPYQAYYDYRRTGYPVWPINPETNMNYNEPSKIPVRWLYPTSEFSYNKENVEAAIQRQYDGVDEVNKIMWILK